MRPLFLCLLLASLITSTACKGLLDTHQRVQVPQLLTPLMEANKGQLIAEVNRLGAIRSIHGKVDLQFQDTSFAEAGVAEKYRLADGMVTVQRPGKVYLVIQVPVIAKDIAQMTSDGSHFRVAILQGDEKYKRFVKGSNDASYPKLDVDAAAGDPANDKGRMNEKKTVNALSNLRPQHLTDALMIRPIDSGKAGFLYTQSEFYQEEADARPPAKKGTRVMRGYYLLEEISQPQPGDVRLTRRFWFDRVGSIRLARLQTFNDQGLLVTDVTYSAEKSFGEDGRTRLPSRIELSRPHDQYKVSVTYQDPSVVVIDREYNPDAFILENKWQLPEVDLDARQNKRATVRQ